MHKRRKSNKQNNHRDGGLRTLVSDNAGTNMEALRLASIANLNMMVSLTADRGGCHKRLRLTEPKDFTLTRPSSLNGGNLYSLRIRTERRRLSIRQYEDISIHIYNYHMLEQIRTQPK